MFHELGATAATEQLYGGLELFVFGNSLFPSDLPFLPAQLRSESDFYDNGEP